MPSFHLYFINLKKYETKVTNVVFISSANLFLTWRWSQIKGCLARAWQIKYPVYIWYRLVKKKSLFTKSVIFRDSSSVLSSFFFWAPKYFLISRFTSVFSVPFYNSVINYQRHMLVMAHARWSDFNIEKKRRTARRIRGNNGTFHFFARGSSLMYVINLRIVEVIARLSSSTSRLNPLVW